MAASSRDSCAQEGHQVVAGKPLATEYTEERVNPKDPYYNADFKGAKFIWTDDLLLDNTVIFRTRIEKPGWKKRWNTKPDLDTTSAPTR